VFAEEQRTFCSMTIELMMKMSVHHYLYILGEDVYSQHSDPCSSE
jgi:hypothetical protein